MTDSIRTLWPRLLLAVGVAVAAGVLFFFDPAGSWFYPHCLFHSLTGLQCPGCGSLRALHALLHGEVRRAVALNPMLFIASLFMAYVAINKRLRPNAPSLLSHPAMVWVIPAVIVLYWILRNLPSLSPVIGQSFSLIIAQREW